MTTMTAPTDLDLAPIVSKIDADVKAAAARLTPREVRYLVDTYYQNQENRKRSENQRLAMETAGEPHGAIRWLAAQDRALENKIKALLDAYSNAQPVGRWARSITGIGPVIAAGLLAHIDIEKAPTVGHIWRFAGLDPSTSWSKGEKRPWNASLKTLCWKIGESFVKVSNNDSDIYGKVWAKRKEWEAAQNEGGAYADQAKAKLEKFKIGKSTEAYKHYAAGHLPPAHIHARAKRYAVKLFLSHLHHAMYLHRYDKAPPMPYIMTKSDHAHFIEPPNLEVLEE